MPLLDVYESDPGCWHAELVDPKEWFYHGGLREISQDEAGEMKMLLAYKERFRELCKQIRNRPSVESVAEDGTIVLEDE